jgi:hypothetical protein
MRSSYGSGIWEFPLSLEDCMWGQNGCDTEHASPSREAAHRQAAGHTTDAAKAAFWILRHATALGLTKQ